MVELSGGRLDCGVADLHVTGATEASAYVVDPVRNPLGAEKLLPLTRQSFVRAIKPYVDILSAIAEMLQLTNIACDPPLGQTTLVPSDQQNV